MHDELRRYVGAVDRIRKESRPDQAEMEKVARELGLTTSIVDDARARAVELQVQGQRFVKSNLLDPAIEALCEAHDLDPWNLETTTLLATAYARRYRGTRSSNDRAEGVRLATEVIERDPHSDDGYLILESIYQGPNRKDRSGWIWGGLIGLACGAMLGLMAGGLGGAIVGGSSSTGSLISAKTSQPVQRIPTVETEAIPVEMTPVPGLELSIRVHRNEAGEVNPHVRFTNTTDSRWFSGRGTMRLLDSSGNMLKEIKLIPSLLPGLNLSYSTRGFKESIGAEKISIEWEHTKFITTADYPPNFPIAKNTPLEATFPTLPAGVGVQFFNRTMDCAGNTCKATIGFRNTGTVPITMLNVSADFGEETATQQLFRDASLALLPGEERSFWMRASGSAVDPLSNVVVTEIGIP